MPTSSLSFEQARHLVEQHAAQLRPHLVEAVPLLESAGRILAEPVHADRPFPPFPRAARDGYAVRASDLANIPARLRVTGEVRAGEESQLKIVPGDAVAIMTGAVTPSGADAVVMLEHTRLHGDKVEIEERVSSGANIIPTGSEARLGEELLPAGARLDYAAIAIAASVGKPTLKVFIRPRIAILATGDEIVDIEAHPGPTQIRNSNSYSIAAQVSAAGGDPVLLPVAPDEPVRLRQLIVDGLGAHLLLLAGGVSMGKYDLVKQILAGLGAEFFFSSVAIQPGKPAVFGKCKDRYFFGLPGNPVSTMVTFELFARPMVEALAGRSLGSLVFVRAQLKSDLNTKTGLKRFLPAVLSGEFEQAEVAQSRWLGSGDIASTARANCYIVVPSDRNHIPAGEWVPVLLR